MQMSDRLWSWAGQFRFCFIYNRLSVSVWVYFTTFYNPWLNVALSSDSVCHVLLIIRAACNRLNAVIFYLSAHRGRRGVVRGRELIFIRGQSRVCVWSLKRDAWKDKCKDVLPRNGNKKRNGARFPPLMYAYRQTLGRQQFCPVRGHAIHADCLLRKLFASSGSSMTWV